MKNLTTFVALTAIFTTAMTTTIDASGGLTITEIVALSGGEFDNNGRDNDILLNAVLTASLDDELGDPDATFTVFAPNDFAFIRTARDLGFEGHDEEGAWHFLVAALTDLGGGDPIPVLTTILLYHVAPEEYSLLDIVFFSIFGQTIDTLEGSTITPFFFRLIDNDPDLRDPRVRWPFNLYASNGIIHNINRVLIPIDI